MFGRNAHIGTGPSGRVWPVLVALLATVVIPSACMLWFMDAAMRNEALAVRQRLSQVYSAEAAKAVQDLTEYWDVRARALFVNDDIVPPRAFGLRMSDPYYGDSFLIRDASGAVLYPTSTVPPPDRPTTMPAAMLEARKLEDEDRFSQAAEAYARIVHESGNADVRATALLARARCLAKAGQKRQALEAITGSAGPKHEGRPQTGLMGPADLAHAYDENGRVVAPLAALFALQLIARPEDPEFRSISNWLSDYVNDYSLYVPPMPSIQRRFLMAALQELDPSAAPMPTQEAEELAAEVLARGLVDPPPRRLIPSSVPGIYLLASADERVIALLREQRILTEGNSALNPASVEGVHLTLIPPGAPRASREPFLILPAGEAMPGWMMHVELTGDDPFASASKRQQALYVWTAAVGIVAVVILAAGVTAYLGRQVRLTRLKNDLIATVSHELKTPLSSMRLLIDTLLEDRCRDGQQAREYFALISKENERLSRLIDNFLNFSRMERNRRAFSFAPLSVEEILAAVMRAVPERITQPPGQFELDVAQDCPPVSGDRDAMVTVVLNLLDNAWKYSRDPRHIVLRAWGRNGRLNLSVADNGIGLSRRAARRAFDRFYQVDSSLSRAAGGCGLGLSIVKFIVEAHGGMVTVASKPGEGSTFLVSLPTLNVLSAARANHARNANGG